MYYKNNNELQNLIEKVEFGRYPKTKEILLHIFSPKFKPFLPKRIDLSLSQLKFIAQDQLVHNPYINIEQCALIVLELIIKYNNDEEMLSKNNNTIKNGKKYTLYGFTEETNSFDEALKKGRGYTYKEIKKINDNKYLLTIYQNKYYYYDLCLEIRY